MELNSRAPAGPIENRWSDHRFHSKLVNPANRRKYRVIVVGNCSFPIAVQAGIVQI